MENHEPKFNKILVQ